MILSKPNHIKIYGHRGARGDLPENTLNSFEYLYENNISVSETDILLTKDLVPVINHDFRLNPDFTKDARGNWLTNNDIKIFELTYEELSKYYIGSINKNSEYGKKFSKQKYLINQKIPKLSELLELSSKDSLNNLIINLEIKSTPYESNLTPPPDKMVEIILNEVNKFRIKNKMIYSSFDWRILGEIKRIDPKIPRAYLTFEKKDRELPRIIKGHGGVAWHPELKDIKKETVKISHDEEIVVNVWTVNEEDDMLRMIDLGVDGIITDYPVILKELCEKRNIKWF